VTDEAVDRSQTDGIEPQRARLRMRGRKRGSSARPLRKNAAILSMVDLLSCAFGGGLFLFMLTAAPSELANAAPQSTTSFAFLKLALTSDAARPLVLLSRTDDPTAAIRIDEAHLIGRSSRRLVEQPVGSTQPKVWTIGATPWDVPPEGSKERPLLLQLEAPAGDWCIKFGLADNDAHARQSSGASISAVRAWVYQSGGTDYSSIEIPTFEPISTVAEPGAVPRFTSACIRVSFIAKTETAPPS